MYKISGLLVAIICFMLTGPSFGEGGGLRVDPGTLLIQNVPVGKERSLYALTGVNFRIYNDDEIDHTFVISAHKPSMIGNGKWSSYRYKEIPDPNWIKIKEKKVRIEKKNNKKVDIFLNIPNDEANYNQRWEVTIQVKREINPKTIFVLEAYPRFQIETEEKGGDIK